MNQLPVARHSSVVAQIWAAVYLGMAIGSVHQGCLVPYVHALVVQPGAQRNILSKLHPKSFRLFNSLPDGEEGFRTAAYPMEGTTSMVTTANITLSQSLLSTPSSSITTTAQFGDVIPLQRKASSSPAFLVDSSSGKDDSGTFSTTSTSSTKTTTMVNPADIKRRNMGVALVSIALAVMNYLWQYLHPLQPIQLLYQMEQQSSPITVIGTTNKPTVVDFWAPWCENCKVLAPTLLQIEEEYGKEINFVMINGDDPSAWPWIEAFGVDAIPHLALVEADGTVDTALIGPIPKQWLEKDLQVLIDNAKLLNSDLYQQEQQQGRGGSPTAAAIAGVDEDVGTTTNSNNRLLRPLPYQMLDVFANRPNERRIQVQTNVAVSNNP